jgi:hypothetical protein
MMNFDVLAEPELEFGVGKHIDIRFGISESGPFDLSSTLRPSSIRAGVVGTNETLEGLAAWLERCRGLIEAKATNRPRLFPSFPGFNEETAFQSSLLLEQRLTRAIPNREIQSVVNAGRTGERIEAAVEVFAEETKFLAENTPAEVILCAVPLQLLTAMIGEDDSVIDDDEGKDSEMENEVDFHDLLKARVMRFRKPVQIVLPMTYDNSKRLRQVHRRDRERQLQDEATRAWNLHTALYYKAGGTPWRMLRASGALATCFVGISFYRTRDNSLLRTSIAQVFDERGDGIVVRGGPVELSKDDRQPHLNTDDARSLLAAALTRYREEHKHLPARAVLHKSSAFNAEELEGFGQALTAMNVETHDFVHVTDSFIRLLRPRAYPPLRGSMANLDGRTAVLYTRGSVPFFATYPGMYVPRPVELRFDSADQTPKFLAQELLALTKMNWNNTQFDGAQPITTRAARQVGRILKYVGLDAPVEPRYSFYM